jgi:hypothetical protein
MPDARRATWSRYELPALGVITDTFTVAAAADRVDIGPILADLEQIDPDSDAWIRAVDRLEAAGYIEGIRVNGLACPAIVTRVTERGLRATGVWPTEESGLEALAAALREGAAKAEAADPEAAGRLRQVAA